MVETIFEEFPVCAECTWSREVVVRNDNLCCYVLTVGCQQSSNRRKCKFTCPMEQSVRHLIPAKKIQKQVRSTGMGPHNTWTL